ncbi:alpha/beta fold hydrolase [Denitrobaculum tricleocarpae]|uniref:Alpha/beta fold hydrolase n=1 Tax=Denitrobaculum tricleocarpae TaxID=2591009 RepID=A0A545TYE2_9PROT|nr:alpha/beta fold hydrolase [Denitrobaculum tricleocarpae]
MLAVTLEIKALGFPQFFLDGQKTDLALRKGVALLVYMAEARAPVGRDVLATLLWPDADQEDSRARLRRTLYKVRTAFGADIIEADRDRLQFSRYLEVTCDAYDFEAACNRGEFAAAARCYSSDYLSGFALDDCPEFEDWVFYRREALRSRLINALERLVEESLEEGKNRDAITAATRLLSLDPLSESAQRYLIRAHLKAGNRAAAERQYTICVKLLRDELDVEPAAETTQLLIDPSLRPSRSQVAAVRSQTRYAASGSLHIAYQVIGDGPLDIVLVPGFVSHVERVWEDARCRKFLTALSGIGRLILFDRRGVGLSDRVGAIPSVEATAQDILSVMEAAGSKRALLFGASEGGPGCIQFAADRPDRLAGLILYGSLAKGSRAKDYAFAMSRRQYDVWLERLIQEWGGPAEIAFFAPSFVGDRQAENWWAGLLRSASSPGAIKGVLEALRDIDVRSLLPDITTPTLVLHRRGDRAVRPEAGRYLAQTIPAARFVELEGDDHWFWAGDQDCLLREIKGFAKTLNPSTRTAISVRKRQKA